MTSLGQERMLTEKHVMTASGQNGKRSEKHVMTVLGHVLGDDDCWKRAGKVASQMRTCWKKIHPRQAGGLPSRQPVIDTHMPPQRAAVVEQSTLYQTYCQKILQLRFPSACKGS
eukprot:5304899-Amphidinium_carterae.1